MERLLAAVRSSDAPRLLFIFTLLVALGCLAGLVARNFATPTDLSAVRDLAGDRSRSWTPVARGITWLGTAAVVAPLAVAACVWLLWRGRRALALAVAVSAAGAALISTFVKLAVDRPRPPVHHLVAANSGSFPSGHATESSAFYTILLIALLSRRLPRPVRLLLAGLTGCLVLAVAFSRLYLGVHYPTDVAAGMLLGGSWTAAVSRRLGRWEHAGQRGVPRSCGLTREGGGRSGWRRSTGARDPAS